MLQYIKQAWAKYKDLPSFIFYLIGAFFCLRLVDAAFFILFNYHLQDMGYNDAQISDFIGFRFLGVLLIAFFLGFYIRGRSVKPFFLAGSILVPFFSFAVIMAVDLKMVWLIKLAMLLWGFSFSFVAVTGLPFILLNTPKERLSEAISLFFLTFSASIFAAGQFSFWLGRIDPNLFTDRNLILLFTGISLFGIYFVSKIKLKEKTSTLLDFQKAPGITRKFTLLKESYDWLEIFQVLFPTLIIATGAGLTIPFINLFFKNVHGIESNSFSLMSSMTYLFVAFGITIMPAIRRQFGYEMAITLFQSLAVGALFIMATTQYYSDWEAAASIAVIFYLIRQPLMNVAGPMTSELSMLYVGTKNQEIVSAFNAAIWAGSWIISSKIFGILRFYNVSYVTIFLITVLIYVIGILWYAFLIRQYHKKTNNLQA